MKAENAKTLEHLLDVCLTDEVLRRILTSLCVLVVTDNHLSHTTSWKMHLIPLHRPYEWTVNSNKGINYNTEHCE